MKCKRYMKMIILLLINRSLIIFKYIKNLKYVGLPTIYRSTYVWHCFVCIMYWNGPHSPNEHCSIALLLPRTTKHVVFFLIGMLL